MKRRYLEYLDEFSCILKKNNCSDEIKEEVEKIKKEIKEFKIKVPLVGGFNAGKSSLINNYLGNSILPEEITPETAIATEIKYGPNMIKAHKKNGEYEIFNLIDIKKLKSDKFEYIEVFYENDNLKKLGEDIVIVDMPGFDSKLDDHNKAILKYLNNGVAFILVIDSADGCMKSSLSTFLYELNSYQLNFAIVVNKSDKKVKKDIEAIVEVVKNNVLSIQENLIIETTSKFDEETPNKIDNILMSFDKEKIFNKYFQDKMLDVCSRIRISLEVLLKNSNIDLDEINKSIRAINDKISELDIKIKKEEENLNRKIDGYAREKILDDIRIVLFNNSNSLANALLEGEHIFSTKLNELLRPVLINVTSSNLEPIFSKMASGISVDLNGIEDIAKGIQSKISETAIKFDGIESGLSKVSENGETSNNFNQYYKIATASLAIMTSVITPWIELIVVLLPDMLKILSTLIGRTASEKARQSIENDVIPRIIENLRPEVSNSLEVMKAEFINDIKENINNKKIDLEKSMNEAIQMKNMKEDEFNDRIEQIKEDIKTISNLSIAILGE